MKFHALVVLPLLTLIVSGCDCGKTRLKNVETPPPVCLEEVCNGKDDDCDGQIDEDLGSLDCGVGACARTYAKCMNGVTITACTEGMPTAELCNGVDDDCNGMVDDGLMPQRCGLGECASVQATCMNGAPLVCMPPAGTTEVCNGKDDDCDGTVDEGLVANTSGDLRITNNPALSDFVYIGKSDTGFGVAWMDTRDGAAGQIYFTSLNLQGVRNSPTDTRVSNTNGSSGHPAAAWNGQTWGLVYSDDAPGNKELYYRPLSATGTPTAAAIRLTNAANDTDWPDLVWNGTTYAVAYDDQRSAAGKHDIYFQRFDKNGTRVGGEVQVTTDPARQSSPILKWNGTEYAMVWTDYRNAGNREIYFRRLAADGAMIGGEVRITNDPADSAWPDLAWNDQDREWAVVWHDTRDGNAEVYFVRVSQSGQKLGNEARLTVAPGFSGYPSIDWNGFEYGVSWQDDRVTASKTEIYFVQVSASGIKSGSELKLSNGTGAASFTTALWNGSTFAFCWRDDRNGATNTEIYFALVGCPR